MIFDIEALRKNNPKKWSPARQGEMYSVGGTLHPASAWNLKCCEKEGGKLCWWCTCGSSSKDLTFADLAPGVHKVCVWGSGDTSGDFANAWTATVVVK